MFSEEAGIIRYNKVEEVRQTTVNVIFILNAWGFDREYVLRSRKVNMVQTVSVL